MRLFIRLIINYLYNKHIRRADMLSLYRPDIGFMKEAFAPEAPSIPEF